MDAERRLVKARTRLLLDQPFWGHLALRLRVEPEQGLGTMATDGRAIYYDPEQVGQWSDAELIGVVAHEVGHCALGHLWRRQSREPMRFNIACDYAVNLLITDSGLILPKGALLDEQYRDMSAEAIYARLPDTPSLRPLDSHDRWGSSSGGSSGDGGDGQGGGQGRGSGQGPLEQEWKEAVAQAAQAARMAGNLPASIAKLVEDLLNPTVDWRELLRDMVQSAHRSDYRLFPPNKRYLHLPVYLPSLYGEHLEVAVAVDSSGSISMEEFRLFISEIRGIAEQFSSYRVHYIPFDADVGNYRVIEDEEGWPAERERMGGTDFRPVFRKVAEECPDVSSVVVLTDGYGPSPKEPPPWPVIWLLSDPKGREQLPEWGDKIDMDREAT